MSAVSGGGWTPGPWVIRPDPSMGGGIVIVRDEPDTLGYHIGEVWTVSGSPQNEANAALIASAPDLFNALSVLADAAESLGIPVDAARASLARATGAATTDGERG